MRAFWLQVVLTLPTWIVQVISIPVSRSGPQQSYSRSSASAPHPLSTPHHSGLEAGVHHFPSVSRWALAQTRPDADQEKRGRDVYAGHHIGESRSVAAINVMQTSEGVGNTSSRGKKRNPPWTDSLSYAHQLAYHKFFDYIIELLGYTSLDIKRKLFAKLDSSAKHTIESTSVSGHDMEEVARRFLADNPFLFRRRGIAYWVKEHNSEAEVEQIRSIVESLRGKDHPSDIYNHLKLEGRLAAIRGDTDALHMITTYKAQRDLESSHTRSQQMNQKRKRESRKFQFRYGNKRNKAINQS